MPTPRPPLTPVFDALKAILERHAAKLVRKVGYASYTEQGFL